MKRPHNLPCLLLLIFLCLLAGLTLSSCHRTDSDCAEGGIAPADVIRGYPIIFKQVYCTGENNDTPVRYSFIELYNTSDKPVSIGGLVLGYAKGDRDKFAPYPLPKDAVIAPHASYLIRCAQAVGEAGELYLDACEKFTLSHYDADLPNLRLSSKRCRLILTTTTKAVKQSELNEGYVLAYFGAYNAAADEPFPGASQLSGIQQKTAGNGFILIVQYSRSSFSCFGIDVT